jgi:hypothetical protein
LAFRFIALTKRLLKLEIPPRNGGNAEKKATLSWDVLFDTKINAFVHKFTS